MVTLVLGEEEEVAALLEPAALVAALAAAFAELARGHVTAPPRASTGGDGMSLLTMPGHAADGALIVKHVGVVPDNPARGLPAHPAVICAFDARTGALTALLGATGLTALRTAGVAALAARLAARPDPDVLAVIGTGPVAAAHLRVLPAVAGYAEVRVAGREPERAAALAAAHPGTIAAPSVEAAVRGADVVCLCTSAARSVLEAAWLSPGAHVSSVGYAPPGGELDPALARAGRLLVETRDAFAPPPAGCAELADVDSADAAELGDVVLGHRMARTYASELTVFKGMGHVVEDLAAARLAIERARATGMGTLVEL